MIFKRGISPTKSLDIGIKRKGNEKEWIESGLQEALGEFQPRRWSFVRDDGTISWIDFHEKAIIIFKNNNFACDFGYHQVYINTGYSCWDTRYQKYFEGKVKKWMKDNGFIIGKFIKNRNRDRYEVNFRKNGEQI